MEEQFNLSNKCMILNGKYDVILKNDVKEFIKLLKIEMHKRAREFLETEQINSEELIMLEKDAKSLFFIIDKLAGDKLL